MRGLELIFEAVMILLKSKMVQKALFTLQWLLILLLTVGHLILLIIDAPKNESLGLLTTLAALVIIDIIREIGRAHV